MITSDELNKAIENFAKSISKHTPGLVYHMTASGAKATNCISNVLQFVEKYGGSVKYGWTFNHRVSPEYGDYLFSTHHAVWHAPDGKLIDITPFHKDQKHHPITVNGSVLFLIDDYAEPIQVENYLIPRPLKYYPIRRNKETEQYMKRLKNNEIKYYKDIFRINIEEP